MIAWAAAVILAPAGCTGLVWAWARHVEPALFAPRHPAPHQTRPAAGWHLDQRRADARARAIPVRSWPS